MKARFYSHSIAQIRFNHGPVNIFHVCCQRLLSICLVTILNYQTVCMCAAFVQDG